MRGDVYSSEHKRGGTIARVVLKRLEWVKVQASVQHTLMGILKVESEQACNSIVVVPFAIIGDVSVAMQRDESNANYQVLLEWCTKQGTFACTRNAPTCLDARS